MSFFSSPTRDRHTVNARRIAIYLMRANLDLPLANIGDLVGRRNHSTILASLKQIDSMKAIDQKTEKALKDLGLILRN